jgi:hypothetical protein
MIRGLTARRAGALAISVLPLVAGVLLCGTAPAVAADRLVLGENFTATW